MTGLFLPGVWLDGIEASIFAVDKNGDLTIWNHHTELLTGFHSEDVLCRPLSAAFGATEGDRLAEALQDLKTGGKNGVPPKECCISLLTKDGKDIELLVKASAQRSKSGTYVGAMCFAEKVDNAASEPAKNEVPEPVVAVQETEEDTREAFLKSTSSAVVELDAENKVTEWNEAAHLLSGLSRSDVMGKPFVSHYVTEDQAEPFKKLLDQARANGEANNKTAPISYRLGLNLTPEEGEAKEADEPTVSHWIVSISPSPFDKDYLQLIGHDVTEQTLQEKATEASAQELRSLIDTVHAPIVGVDVNGIVNEWNEKIADITGYSKAEAMNKPLVDTFISAEHKEALQKVLKSALAGEGIDSYDLELRTKDDEIKHFLANATPRRDKNGMVVGVFSIAQDVTEAAKHDRAVAAMANELRQLVDTANAPIFGIDVGGAVNEWNDKTAEITGYTKEEAFAKPLVETFIVPSLRQSVQEVMDNALQGLGTSNYELEFRTKDDEIRYLLVNATTRRDAENNIVGVVGVAQDVTETAQHDRAVAAMARELRQLVDTANAPIFGIDVNGNVNEWNDKTAEITGFSGDEAFNRPLVETFIVEKLQPSVQEVLDNALRGRGTSNYELEFVTKSGEIRYLLVNATTRRDAENNIVGVVGVAQDVTEAAKHDRAVAAMANELRQLIDTANAPIFGIDVDGDVNEWNDKTAEITGFTKEEAFDCPLVETFIVPSLRASIQEVMDNALQGRGTSNYELEFRTKSNEIRHLLVNATTRRDAENNVVGVVGVAQDVTEAVQRDRAVAGMANELRQLIDTANAPIFGIDCDGNINEWNNKTAEITGYTKEEAFDEPLVSKFIVPSLRHSVDEVMSKALSGDETSNYELEFVAKSGEIRYLLVNATTRRDPENNVVGGKWDLLLAYCYISLAL